MDSQRWTKVRAILERALEQGDEQRAAWLARECGDDAQLMAEVESLLANEPDARSFEPPTRSDVARAIEDRNLGRRVGPYTIERLLGEGGMGAVYLARRADADFEQRVALKLTKRGMDTDDVLAQFRRERALLAALRHPGIAQLYDGGATDDGLPWFAMEYVDGQPIDAWCTAQRLALRQRVQLFVEVCAAVQFAHQNLVVHRDLKPSNILVTSTGAAKLLDFGIAKLLASDGVSTAQRTLAEQRRLTPDYASPEQLRGEAVTTASDVYSLGVILCELLTGTNPFRASHNVERGDPPKPSTLLAHSSDVHLSRSRQNARELRGDLDTIVTTALAVDIERRYASVEALSAELKRWLDGLPIHARPATAAYLASRFVRRNRVAVAAGTVVFFALLGGLIAARAGYVEAVKQRGLAELREQIAKTQSQRANSVLSLTRRMLEGANPEDVKQKDYTLRQLLDDFEADFGKSGVVEPEVEASVQQIIGHAYCELGLTDKARKHMERAMELRPDLRASVEELDVSLRQDWILLLHNESRYGEALDACNELFARLEAAHVPGPVLIETLQQRGDLHRHERHLDDAEKDLRRALEISIADGRASSSDLAMSRYKLAQVLDAKHSLDEAGQLAREALEGMVQGSGSESSDAASGHGLVGMIAEHAGDYETALASYKRSVEIERAVHGDTNYRLAPLVDDLGRIYSQRGDYAAALPFVREAVAISRQTLGSDDPGTATALSNLGRVLDRQGDYVGAETAFRECLEIRLARYGEDNSDVARSLNNLAMTLNERGKLAESEAMLRRALAIRTRLSGENDPSLCPVLINLSQALTARGDFDGARDAVVRALAIQRALPKPDPLTLSGVITNVAAAKMRDGEVEDAIALYEEAYELRRSALTVSHPDTARALSMVGESLLRSGKPGEAEPKLLEAEGRQIEALGAAHADVARTRQALGELAEQKGQSAEAERLFRAAFEVRRKVYGDRWKATVESARGLVRVLDARGATEEAAALRAQFDLDCTTDAAH